jgi:mannan endo-1,4-beta-mannosidase
MARYFPICLLTANCYIGAMKYLLASIPLILLFAAAFAQSPFIRVDGTHFIKNGKPYYFLGTNFWYGLNLGSKGEGGDRERLLRELDRLKALGVTNLRVMAASEGPDSEPWRMVPALQTGPGEYNEDVLDGLDFLLAEMGRRDMHAVMCLNNFWPWSGGMAQYLAWYGDKKAIPYPPPAEGGNWAAYQVFASRFYVNEAAMQAYERHIAMLIERKNPYTGRAYKDDPTIMAWQLANEPRGILKKKAYRRWVRRTAVYIHARDPNHLVSIGGEGWTPSRLAGTSYQRVHRIAGIDYATLHIWVQNWGWYDPKAAAATLPGAESKARAYLDRHVAEAQRIGKPAVLEEFGIARDDDDHDPAATVTDRDQYYTYLFSAVLEKAAAGSALAGCNFWAWGGEGRPQEPHAAWKAGDDFIGDPPHEYQGWYSVYDQDTQTLAIIADFAAKMHALGQ